MSSDIIIGLLALFTIGGVLALSVFHFGFHLRDPKNKEAAKRALVDDGSSAHTNVRGGDTPQRNWMRPAQKDEPPAAAVSAAAAAPSRTTAEGHPMVVPPQA